MDVFRFDRIDRIGTELILGLVAVVSRDGASLLEPCQPVGSRSAACCIDSADSTTAATSRCEGATSADRADHAGGPGAGALRPCVSAAARG